ncbi:cytochrome C assembly family protein [Alteromonas halophila]|uniref:Inner membrane protein YpjD n=1 Tax=Alteromonas halophila TaxID=516698 RepID=A0A918MTV6_9ALTE|nr:cytochrome c biogenesis protein CcsA [Alteromonas halophila]GGW74591.1 inner membrane protein YpjD [Alteromonas halophila]
MDIFLAFLAIGLYLIAAVLLSARLSQAMKNKPSLALAFGGLAAVLHLLFLVHEILGMPGQNMSITNVLSLTAWLITVVLLASSRFVPNTILLPVVFSFSALTLLVTVLIPARHIMHIELQPGLVIHIVLSLLAYCVLVIAFLYALQMSFITYRLKQKGASLIHSSLPPLTLVEGILFKMLAVGTVLLFVAQLSGFVFLDDMFGKAYAHKTVLSLAALVVFVILVAGQRLWGWRGKQVFSLTVIGVILLSLAYFGSRVVREVLL